MRMYERSCLLLSALLLSAGLLASAQEGGDYPQWRGRQRDGSASSFRPPAAWPDALTARWTLEVGEGYASPILAGDRVFTLTRIADQEVATAVDAATGKVVWQTRY